MAVSRWAMTSEKTVFRWRMSSKFSHETRLSPVWTLMSVSGLGIGNGCRKSALTIANSATLPPIASASVTMAVPEKPLFRPIRRSPYRHVLTQLRRKSRQALLAVDATVQLDERVACPPDIAELAQGLFPRRAPHRAPLPRGRACASPDETAPRPARRHALRVRTSRGTGTIVECLMVSSSPHAGSSTFTIAAA